MDILFDCIGMAAAMALFFMFFDSFIFIGLG